MLFDNPAAFRGVERIGDQAQPGWLENLLAGRTVMESYGLEPQVVLTTHSPLLLNHFAAEEVLLVTRDESNVHVQRLSEARGLDELASEMALGELWYNIGDSNLARPA